MISIDRQKIKEHIDMESSKKDRGREMPLLYQSFALSNMNLNDTVRDFCAYEMGNWINGIDRWIKNRQFEKLNTCGYKRGTILIADLGEENFGHELSFPHPCIVLYESKEFMFIVPCSSKKYGKPYPEIIDATIADGFRRNTGILTNNFRWISKNRVISKCGTVSTRILNEIDNALLKLIPSYKKIMFQKNMEIQNLQKEIERLDRELKEKEEYIKQLESRNA